ncbi:MULTISPECIES: protein-glutamate O-methyltransferase CheR [unclassified Paenibacillus]|uniref:CheR family methyltransferase n=1 Tax=unclassified Paenibacillus TaxID=185978 RepID=UPI001C11F2FE|nr:MULTISPECIES: protein-glutamate O-methyltransferase CheR [unclassified Paenibacillus]MBU5444407.1 protein-glutamate O-methyltransferase CheR [Paenibacillus sp. MSJ-34]CAH0120166.1 Chemotaxis protein methyltransferase [Paenibacillus sp. CECT 9249]
MLHQYEEEKGLLEEIEICLLLEGIYRHYGHDFRNYSYSSIRRRIWHRIRAERLRSISALQEAVLHDPGTMERLFSDFSINVTEMFRDPSFFLAIRRKVVPLLQNLPAIRIWHAGCSTGEEVYSMAILLYEEGLYDRCTIYGTDMNHRVLEQAESGSFPLQKMQLYTKNYLQSGGEEAFSEYYKVKGNQVAFHPFLSENIVFSQHNLATDHSFNEFHIIICRNVLIYFNEIMHQRVIQLFKDSLVASGFLGLGRKEGIHRNLQREAFEVIDPQEKIYRKM